MRNITMLAIAGLFVASPVAAQGAKAPAARMTTDCPMHLTTLALSPVQDSAFAAIRAAHRAEMHAVHERLGMKGEHAAGHDMKQHHASAQAAPMREAMQASMKRSLEAARAVLTDAQRVKFDAAAEAHAQEKKSLAASGAEHECGDCCPDHDAMHGSGAAKHSGH